MQYLSKAYQYYSGINPATLSGAIDVIVVRRRGEDGEDIYSCSPFHVRFGKLQVLRAGEKRVTLTLPDNLSSENGHRAPVWMKVGEAGEAFFVVETDAEVPEELQTSPVMSATQESPPVSPIVEEDDRKIDPGDNVTQQPFGQDGRANMHGEPEPFELEPKSQSQSSSQNASQEPTNPREEPTPRARRNSERRGSLPTAKAAILNNAKGHSGEPRLEKQGGQSSVSPSSILNTATSYLPSFLSSGNGESSTPEDADAKKNEPKSKQKHPGPLPPNPLRNRSETRSESYYHHAETLKDYVRDHKAHVPSVSVGLGNLGLKRERKGSTSSLKSLESSTGASRKSSGSDPLASLQDKADARLPALKDGEGEAPEVLYNEDVVLDMAGYHRPTDSSDSPDHLRNLVEQEPADRLGELSLDDDTAKEDTPEASEKRLRDNMGLGEVLDVERNDGLVKFAQDLLLSAGAITAEDNLGTHGMPNRSESDVVWEIKRRLSFGDAPDHDEEADDIRDLPEKSTRSGQRAGFSRGASEPPEVGSAQQTTTSGYTWEWGGFPTRTPAEESSDPLRHARINSLIETESPGLIDRPSLAATHKAGAASVSAPDVNRIDPPRPKPSALLPASKHLERQQSAPPLVGLSLSAQSATSSQTPGGLLKNDEADPYKFILDMTGASHVFELGLGGDVLAGDEVEDNLDEILSDVFEVNRITFKRFVEDPKVVDQSDLVIRYDSKFLTWQNASPILAALAVYRRSLVPPVSPGGIQPETLPPLSSIGVDPTAVDVKGSKGYGWSRWWRRGQSSGIPLEPATTPVTPLARAASPEIPTDRKGAGSLSSKAETQPSEHKLYYAKTLRLTSSQLSELKLKPGANRVIFSVTSSYSGMAQCSARIFLWEESDHVVISDIDGTITKSDALGHVFAAIGRDWTHLGVAKLYTDVCNNGYKIMYLTSRAIGQADSTRDYLKSISQGKYQLPEGPVIMSPDRLFTSLHREVIMRKPELFKMACLRDIQRLFGGSRKAFYAGFGNRITDAMSYRSVNVPSSRIFTIDSYGEVKMELLELAGYKSSYIHMTDLVDQMFPPVHREVIPEYTDFNFWRPSIPDIAIPDLTPPQPVSPALSATSDASGRMSMLGRLTGIARRASRQTVGSTDEGRKATSASSRPSSPLSGPVDDGSDYGYDEDAISDRGEFLHDSRPSSMPGSFEDKGEYLGDEFFDQRGFQRYKEAQQDQQGRSQQRGGDADVDLGSDHDYDDRYQQESEDDDVYPEMFDDDLLATGEMSKVPY